MLNSRMDKSQVKIVKKGQEEDDVLFWLERMSEERILALETIQQEYNQWKYNSQRGFQRIYTVIKRQRS